MAFYQSREVVIVRDDLGKKETYNMFEGGVGCTTNSEMRKLSGKPVTITYASRGGYSIREDRERFCWTDEMF